MRKTLITLALLASSSAAIAAQDAGQSATSDTMMNKDTRSLLAKVVNQALNYSPEIQVAGTNKTAANYEIDQVKGARWPQIQLGSTAPMASFGSGSESTNNRLKDSSFSVSVTTTVFDWGKNRENIGSATQQSHAAAHQYEFEKQQIAFNTLGQMIELSRNQQNQKITQGYVQRMRELVT